jgi:hypothetical protein
MQYDEDGNRIYKEFVDLMGQKVTIKKAADKSYAEGCVQIGVGGDTVKWFFYPTRLDAAKMIDALAAFLGDTDGIPDLPEPDAGG